MLLGYHLLWSTTANVVGTDEQQESVQEVIIRNNFFVGGAVNPRDNDLKITDDGDEIVFHGSKNFNTGGGYFTYSLYIKLLFIDTFLFFLSITRRCGERSHCSRRCPRWHGRSHLHTGQDRSAWNPIRA